MAQRNSEIQVDLKQFFNCDCASSIQLLPAQLKRSRAAFELDGRFDFSPTGMVCPQIIFVCHGSIIYQNRWYHPAVTLCDTLTEAAQVSVITSLNTGLSPG